MSAYGKCPLPGGVRERRLNCTDKMHLFFLQILHSHFEVSDKQSELIIINNNIINN